MVDWTPVRSAPTPDENGWITVDDRAREYATALDELDRLRADGRLGQGEWELRRHELLAEATAPTAGAAVGRLWLYLLGAVIVVLVVLLILALVL